MSAPQGLPQVQEDIARIADLAEEAAGTAEYEVLVVKGDFSEDGVAGLESDLVHADAVLPLNVDFEALRRFKHMRREFEAAGQPLWTRAEVHVDRAGEATVRFTYPD